MATASLSPAPPFDHPNSDYNDTEPQAILYGYCDTRMTAKEARSMFDTLDHSKLSCRAPFKPSGGAVYFYDENSTAHHSADGYRWQNSTGYTPLPTRTCPLVYRKSKKIITKTSGPHGDNRFIVYLYRLPTKPSPLLVHYVGDSSIYQPLPHRNAVKNKDREFFRSAPTIAAHVKLNLDKQPQQLYEEIVSTSRNFNPAYAPRDRKQIDNIRYGQRAKNRLSPEKGLAVSKRPRLQLEPVTETPHLHSEVLELQKEAAQSTIEMSRRVGEFLTGAQNFLDNANSLIDVMKLHYQREPTVIINAHSVVDAQALQGMTAE